MGRKTQSNVMYNQDNDSIVCKKGTRKLRVTSVDLPSDGTGTNLKPSDVLKPQVSPFTPSEMKKPYNDKDGRGWMSHLVGNRLVS